MLEFNTKRFKVSKKYIDLFFSADCNMRCTYCYIPKGPVLQEKNKELREALKNGTILKDILSVTKNPSEIKGLDLWGAEPTINADWAEPVARNFFKAFRNIEQVGMSTNMLAGHKQIIKILEAFDTHAPKLNNKKLKEFRLQFSVDGPSWITDKNRFDNATSLLLQCYEKFLLEVSKRGGFKNIQKLKISFKPTISTDNMKEMLDKDKAIEWFKFNEELVKTFNRIISDKNLRKSVILPGPASMTIVNVGRNTKKDGEIFRDFLEVIYSIDTKKAGLKSYKQPLFIHGFTIFDRFLIDNRTIATKFMQMTCGGGDGQFAYGYQRDVYPCHRAFNLRYYNRENTARLKQIAQNLSVQIDDNSELARFDYMLRSYHDFMGHRISSVKAMARRLAMYGQIDDIYLKDEAQLDLLAIMVTSIGCYMDTALDYTMSINIPALSLIRFFGNGALQLLYKAWYRTRGFVRDDRPLSARK